MIEAQVTPVGGFVENRRFWGFTGLIGRKWYAIHKATAILMLLLPVVVLAATALYSAGFERVGTVVSATIHNQPIPKQPITLDPTTSTVILVVVGLTGLVGLLLIIPVVAISIGLDVRRLRDMLGRETLEPWMWALAALVFLSGAHILTPFVLMLVPGALSRQAEAGPAVIESPRV